MGAYRRGKVWYVDIPAKVSSTGRRERVAVGGRRAAEEYLAKVVMEGRERRIFEGSAGFSRTWDELFEEMLRDYSPRRHRESSRLRLKVAAKVLTKTFGFVPVARITPKMIEQYKSCRVTTVSNSTVNRELACLRLTLRLALRWDWIKASPFEHVEFLKEPEGRTRWYTPEEFERLIEPMPDHLEHIVTFAAATGMRMEEILSLKWNQVNLSEYTAMLDKTKTGKFRVVGLNDTAVSVIRRQIRKVDVEEIFWSRKTGKRFRSVSNAFRKYANLARIDGRFHDLRHTYSTWNLLYGGRDLNDIREQLGHKSMRMTLRYAHLTTQRKIEAAKSIDKVFQKKLFTFLLTTLAWHVTSFVNVL